MRPVLHARAQIVRSSVPLADFIAQPHEPDACWEWPGHRDRNGYGLVSWWGGDSRQRHTTAHRLVYILVNGDVPGGFTIDHLCVNPPCCNPAHLEAVPPSENNARSATKAAATMRSKRATGTCPKGHAEWNSSGQCAACIRISQAGRWALLNAARGVTGLTRREYGRRYGYSQAVAAQIVEGAHV